MVGLKILDDFTITIGENLDELIAKLNEKEVKFNVPYKGGSDKNQNMILFIETFGVEINAENKLVSFIKSNNGELNYITNVSNLKPVFALRNMMSKTAELFDVEESVLRLDRFESNTMTTLLSVPYSKDKKVKITLIKGAHGNVYLETMELINY